MIQAIIKLLLLSPETVSEEVLWALAGIYLMLWAATILSIFFMDLSPMRKVVWLMLVTLLPVLGIALHCFACLFRADYQFLKQFGIVASKGTSTSQNSRRPHRNTSSQPSI
jgi:fatty acid desaturase